MTTTSKTCPITLPQFKAAAPGMSASLERGDLTGDASIYVAPKEFSTGGIGLWGQGKVHLNVGGIAVACQVGINMVLIGGGDMTAEQKRATLTAMKPSLIRLHVGTQGKGPALEGDRIFPATIKAPFSTGSFGWNVSTKLHTDEATFQVGINVTVVGSKDAARS